ncbi:hypothetical protein Leryth_006275 [Lithospermum erythrorhizon]|nr:hypothetical protein Leryth_006275 [Lithospermum erythrorhizon]
MMILQLKMNVSISSFYGINGFHRRLINHTKISYGSIHVIRRAYLVYCSSETKEVQIRKCSPFLEKELLGNGVLPYTEWKVVPDIWRTSAEKYGERTALIDPYHDPPTNLSYKQLEQEILNFSEGLRVVGIKPDEKLALFADNSCRWLVADQGIMATGAINVVRGSRSSVEELLQIYNHSESIALVVDNPEMYKHMQDTFHSKASVKFVVLLWGEKSSIAMDTTEELCIYNYEEIIKLGEENRLKLLYSEESRRQYIYESINSDDVATLIYTSGTTGNPKGVMLTHKNLMHQITSLWDIVPAIPGDRFLSMLPPWHAYERTCEYFTLTYGVEQVYTTVPNLKEDLKRYQPHYMISVPLVFETLYNGIQKQIHTSSPVQKLVALMFLKISMAFMEAKRIYEGKCLTKSPNEPFLLFSALDWLWARTVSLILWPIHVLAKKVVYSKIQAALGLSKGCISGGGSLPTHVDKFYEAIGINLQNGYGLTETSPVVAARQPDCNVLGSIGPPLQQTEIKVVNSETGEDLPAGSKGIVKVRGPEVMKGYYKNSTATSQTIDENGWLNTGDIGWIAPRHYHGRYRRSGGVIVLEGRAKDTIVLSTGENVEPSEIEEAAMRSPLIQQIVVIGQDRRRLGALIVPNKEEILAAAKKLSTLDSDSLELSQGKMDGLLREELRKWTSECRFQIGPFLIVEEPFTIDGGLMTPTMKIKRDRVVALYKEQIENLFK